MWRVAASLFVGKFHLSSRSIGHQSEDMWRVASLFVGKSRLSSPSFVHVNAAAAALHTTPSRDSHILSLSRVEVLKFLAVKSKAGFDRVEDAHALFHRMLQFEPMPFVADDFSRLLDCVDFKMNEFRSAVFLYREMRFRGVPIDGRTMSIAVHSYCHLNQFGFGFAILGSIFKLGFKLDLCTLTILFHGLIKAGRISEGLELYRIMVVVHVFCATSITYGPAVTELCESGNTFKAIEVLRFVEKEGPLNPPTTTYNTLIDSLCKDMRKVDEAASNITTYSSVIQGLCNLGRWKEASSLLTEMASTGIYPDVLTFSTLVDAFSKQGWVEEAEVILKIMIERGGRPDAVTYNSLMDGYCLQGEMDKALRVLHNMFDQGCLPDIQSYNILLNGYCKKRDVDEVCALYEAILCQAMKYNVITFKNLLPGFQKKLVEVIRNY